MLNDQVRFLLPYAGITQVRFEGSSVRPDSQPKGSPSLCSTSRKTIGRSYTSLFPLVNRPEALDEALQSGQLMGRPNYLMGCANGPLGMSEGITLVVDGDAEALDALYPLAGPMIG